MPNPSPGSRETILTARRSLKGVTRSVTLLTYSQLCAARHDLRAALSIVEAQIRVEESKGYQLVIDISDIESDSDEENEGENEATNRVDGEENESEPLTIPGPYQISTPDLGKSPGSWSVVDYGTEVGIFADKELSARAIAGIARGHQVEVGTWAEAVALYNTLYYEGKIVRVRS